MEGVSSEGVLSGGGFVRAPFYSWSIEFIINNTTLQAILKNTQYCKILSDCKTALSL